MIDSSWWTAYFARVNPDLWHDHYNQDPGYNTLPGVIPGLLRRLAPVHCWNDLKGPHIVLDVTPDWDDRLDNSPEDDTPWQAERRAARPKYPFDLSIAVFSDRIGSHSAYTSATWTVLDLDERAGRDVVATWLAEQLGLIVGITTPLFYWDEPRELWVLAVGPARAECIRFALTDDGQPDHTIEGLPTNGSAGIEALKVCCLWAAGYPRVHPRSTP